MRNLNVVNIPCQSRQLIRSSKDRLIDEILACLSELSGESDVLSRPQEKHDLFSMTLIIVLCSVETGNLLRYTVDRQRIFAVNAVYRS